MRALQILTMVFKTSPPDQRRGLFDEAHPCPCPLRVRPAAALQARLFARGGRCGAVARRQPILAAIPSGCTTSGKSWLAELLGARRRRTIWRSSSRRRRSSFCSTRR